MSTASKGGAEGQDRTGDTAIFSRVLYRLSYLGPMANRVGCPSAEGRIPRAFGGLPQAGRSRSAVHERARVIADEVGSPTPARPAAPRRPRPAAGRR